MEASAKETGLRQRTADDNLQIKGLSRLRRDSDGESDNSDSEGDGGGESDDSGEIDDALLEGLDVNGGEEAGGVLGEGSEERAVLDSQFETVSCFAVVVGSVVVVVSSRVSLLPLFFLLECVGEACPRVPEDRFHFRALPVPHDHATFSPAVHPLALSISVYSPLRHSRGRSDCAVWVLDFRS